MGADGETLIAHRHRPGAVRRGAADAVAHDGRSACRASPRSASLSARPCGSRSRWRRSRAIAWFVSRGAGDRASSRLAAVVCQRQADRRPRAGAERRHVAHRQHDRTAGRHRGAGGRAALRAGRASNGNAEPPRRQALSRAVGGQRISCTPDGTDGAGLTLAYCTAGTTDINGELVRKGHVFAEQAFFARYASQEQEARAAKAGLWVAAARPSGPRSTAPRPGRRPSAVPRTAARSRAWCGTAIASTCCRAPPDYERGRVQTARGGRWFCSEREALSAGFKAASRD